MLANALYAYLHFAAILTLASALGGEALLLRTPAGQGTLAVLGRAELLYDLSAGAVFATGAARVFLAGKPVIFYEANPVFWIKIALVALVAALSVSSGLRIWRWRKALARDPSFVPEAREWLSTRRLVFAELHLLAVVPVPAVLMARGIGLSS